MYVIFPLICYNAAYALDSFKKVLKKVMQHSGISRYESLPVILERAVIVVHVLLSLARLFAQLRAYSAPMHVLDRAENSSIICFGKEWYRFPSSFFVPENSRPAFIKSSFNGLLPGKFNESNEPSWRSGIWQVPMSMNDRNIEELSHLVLLP